MERRVMILAIVLFVVLGGLWAYGRDRVTVSRVQTTEASRSPQRIRVVRSVEETSLGRQFVDEGVEPEMAHWGMVTLTAYVESAMHRYPIKSLRERLHNFIHPVEGMEPRVHTVFELGVEYDPREHQLAVAYFTETGEPVLELNAIPLYRHWLEMKDAEGAFLDFLMLVLLHERFHLQEQHLDLRFDMEGKTPDEIAALENAAYLDGARAAQVMRDEGRAPVAALNPLIHGLWAYVIGGDDLTHPIWVQYGRLITDRENTFVEVLSAWNEENYQE